MGWRAVRASTGRTSLIVLYTESRLFVVREVNMNGLLELNVMWASESRNRGPDAGTRW